jgi:hypothetical protein
MRQLPSISLLSPRAALPRCPATLKEDELPLENKEVKPFSCSSEIVYVRNEVSSDPFSRQGI